MNRPIKQTLCILLALLVMLSGIPSAVLSYAVEENSKDGSKAIENTVSDDAASASEEVTTDNLDADGEPDSSATNYPAFSDEASLNGVTVNVNAPEGAFPAGASLSVAAVSKSEQKDINGAIEEERSGNTNIAASYTFDIKVLDADGNEAQPADGKSVAISFALDEVADEGLSTHIYHIKEKGQKLKAEALSVATDGATATVETDGFSYYTVEFTYGDKQYVLEGGGVVKLDDLLESIGIEGEVKGVSVSDSSLFNVIMGSKDGVKYIYRLMNDEERATVIANEDEDTREANKNRARSYYAPTNDPNGTVRWVASYQPFDTEEWLDVVMTDGSSHHIIVTDLNLGDDPNAPDIPGIYQGENLTNFAPLVPVADVWIDSELFSAVSSGHPNIKFTEFIEGPLMKAANSPFKSETYTTAQQGKAVNYTSTHFVYYDSTVQKLDGYDTTKNKTTNEDIYQSYNFFSGVVGTYKWKNAAVRMNEDGSVEYFDVNIEYSNPMISLQPIPAGSTMNETEAANVTDPDDLVQWDDAYVGLFSTNAITTGAKDTAGNPKQERYGLRINAKPYLTYPADYPDQDKRGKPVTGIKFYFPMSDIDVDRSTNDNFAGFYQGNSLLANYDESLRRYSEAVTIPNSGLVYNSDGNSIYIPGSEGGYLSTISYDNNTYTFSAVKADDHTFNSGFLALVKNDEFALTAVGAGAGEYGGVLSYVLAGGEYNYRLRHSTETLKQDGTSEADGTKGGTIRTTREGNHNGELNDGQIIEPSMIASAVGQTIVYTFTPQPGYALSGLYVWNDPDKTDFSFPNITDMKGHTKIREGDGSNNTYEAFDDDGDGVIDRYTYTFEGIHADNAIHVVWSQTGLDIRKSVTGSGAADDTFTFTIKAWGDPDSDGIDDYVDFTNVNEMGSLVSEYNITHEGGGVYKFELGANETLSIPPGVIPFDYQYEVNEIQVNGKYGKNLDGWTPVGSTVSRGTLTADKPFGKASFTNKRKKEIPPNKKLTVKKVWDNDTSNIRPKNITINIQGKVVGVPASTSTLREDMFRTFGSQQQFRANATAIKWGTKAQAEAAASNPESNRREAMRSYGDTPVYLWRGTGTESNTLYIYSDATIYLTGSAASLFYDCRELTDISGLEYIHTDFVTNMYQMFRRCVKLTDLRPIAGWNVASVTSGNGAGMELMFAAGDNTNTTRMTLSDISPLKGWDTRNVVNMKSMFRNTSVGDLSEIAGWDVTRVTNMEQMFAYTYAAQTAQTALASGWDPGLCTNFTNMFQNADGGSEVTAALSGNLPVFAARTGEWNNTGTTYSNVAATHASQSSSVKPTDTQASFFKNPPVISNRAHDVDEADSNTWVYEFEVPEGSVWKIWETLPESYTHYYTLSKTTYQGPTAAAPTDLGSGIGKEDNPVTGAEAESVTVLTNTRNEHELRIKKDSSPATSERFTFTLKLWSISESNHYDLPSGHPKLGRSLTRKGPGTYEFTLTPPGTEELMLPAGIRYSVTETPLYGWSLISEHNTKGLLNTDKEASFMNAKNDTLKVNKLWENDYMQNVWMSQRPQGQASLGIKVVTRDKNTRWAWTGETILKPNIVGTPEDQRAYQAVKTLYDGASVIPELKDQDKTADIATVAPKLLRGVAAIGTIVPAGDYVVDTAGSTGEYTMYPVVNVPFEHIYTVPDYFTEDDPAGNWLYEYIIAKGDDVLSVEETKVPPYYQKEYTTTNVNGEVIYNITNTLDARDLKIEKETVDDEPGLFQFTVKFWFDTSTEVRHPVKVGHSQFIKDKDGEGNEFHEYEFSFENDVSLSARTVAMAAALETAADNGDGTYAFNGSTYSSRDALLAALPSAVNDNGDGTYSFGNAKYSSKSVKGLSEEIDDVVQSGSVITASEGELLLLQLKRLSDNAATMVNGADSEYTSYHKTTMKLSDLGLEWNGTSKDIIYVEQDAADVGNMFDSGRRLDWFIIPEPTANYGGTEYDSKALAEAAAIAAIVDNNDGTYTFNGMSYNSKNDAEDAASKSVSVNGITVRTPYTLRTNPETTTTGVVLPKQLPSNVHGGNGTYTFTLRNDEHMIFNDLPVGVSYEVVETKQLGWDLVETRNTTGNMLQKNDNSGNIEEIWNYKGAPYTKHSDAEAAAVADVATSTVSGVTEYTNNAVYTSKDDAVNAAIIMNNDSTWTYDGNTYPTYDDVTSHIVMEVKNCKNADNTYSYDGNKYYTRGAVDNIARANIVDNGDGTYTYKSHNGLDWATAENLALCDVQESTNSGGKLVFTFDGVEYLRDAQAEEDAIADVIPNPNGTFTFESVTGTRAEAEAAARAAVIDNMDNTYTYKGTTYPSAAAAEAAELSKATANNDNTYTVDQQQHSTLAAAKSAAEALVRQSGSGTNIMYTLPAKYASKYDAEKAAKAAITKEPYEPREALFRNEREKGTIKVKKETVSNDEGTFTFRMMTGRVVQEDDVKDKSGKKLNITRIYPKDPANPAQNLTSKQIRIIDVTTHDNYTEYTTADGDVYKMTDKNVGGVEERRVYKNNVEISPLFNIVYPREFTDMSGMNYKFTTTSSQTTLDIETTTFEFKLKNDEFATIANIPYGSRDRIWEVSDAEGNLIEDGWELVAIDGDIGNTQFNIDGVTYDGIDAVMETTHTVEHSFLNDRKKVDLTIKKLATGNQGSRDQYFKFKIDIENAGDRTFHLDMTKATTTFGSGVDGAKAPNSATSYTRNVILNGYRSEDGNTRDDAQSITYESASVSQRRSCEWEWTEGGAAYRSKWNSSKGWVTYKDNSTTVGIEPPKNARRVTQRSQHINTDAASGKATVYVYLQHNQSATLKDLPIGSKYEVREIDPTGYRTSTAIIGPYTFNGTTYATQAAAETAAIATITHSSGKYIFDGKEYTTEAEAKAAARAAVLPDVLTGENWNNSMKIVGGSAITTGEKSLLYDGMHVKDSFIRKNTELTFTNMRSGAVPTEVRMPMVLGGLLLMLASLEWLILRYRKRRREAYYEE